MKPVPLLSLYRERMPWEKEHGECGGGMCSLNSGLSWTPSDGFLWCLCKVRGSTDGHGCKRLKLWQVFVKWTLLPLKKVVFPKGIHLWRITKGRRSVREEITSPSGPFDVQRKGHRWWWTRCRETSSFLKFRWKPEAETSEDELGPLSPLAAKKVLVAVVPHAWRNFGKVQVNEHDQFHSRSGIYSLPQDPACDFFKARE